MAEKMNSALADDVEERARLIARSLLQTFPPDFAIRRGEWDHQKWIEMLGSLECDAKLRALPVGKLRLYTDWCYNDWKSLETHTWDKFVAMSVASAIYWAKRGDWGALADYVERGDDITPEIRSFIAKILRGEITKPGKPATLAKLKRDFEIVKWIYTERIGGKSKTVALEKRGREV